jgi:hypothetical protein
MTEFSESDSDRQMVQSEDPKPVVRALQENYVNDEGRGVNLKHAAREAGTGSQAARHGVSTPSRCLPHARMAETNIAFDEFFMGLFEKGLAADEVDAKWPISYRFKQGAAKLFSTLIPELKAWIDKQRAPDVPGAEEGDMADDDDSEKAEEEA